MKSQEPIATDKSSYVPLDNSVRAEAFNSSVPVTDSISFKENQVSDRPARAELMARNKDREMKIKEFTLKLKTPNGLTEMENEPAYMRRKVSLDNVQKSNESSVSRFTLSENVDENGEKRTELRDNNPFLHDNVD